MEKKSFDDDISISISVFYNYIGWDVFIIDCLVQFIDSNKQIRGHILSLSRNRGEHIKIFFITTKSDALSLAIKADQFFKSFISANIINSTSNDTDLKNEIFCNFKPNTIQYGIYDLYSFGTTDKYNSLDQEFSKLLILVFKEYKSETIPSLTEIMIELLTSFVDYLELEENRVVEIFDNLMGIELKRYNSGFVQKALDISKKNFLDNKEEITLFLRHGKEQSELCNKSKNNWQLIIEKYDESKDGLQIEREIFLISKLCDVFDFSERINAFYLFLNGFKLTTNWSE